MVVFKSRHITLLPYAKQLVFEVVGVHDCLRLNSAAPQLVVPWTDDSCQHHQLAPFSKAEEQSDDCAHRIGPFDGDPIKDSS